MLLRSTFDDGSGGHAESLAATLAEHRQHLVSIQVKNVLQPVHHMHISFS